jgi:hypothetical protein
MPGPEARIENEFVRFVESHGLHALKLRIDGHKGFPDRTILTPNGIVFIEFKAPSGRVSAQQRLWIDRLRELGYHVEVCTSADQAKQILEDYL